MSETAQDVSAGTLLRRAREASGLHVAALAVSLKVPVRKLEALEAGRYDELPDAVFARALASSVCRTLKVDPRPILDRLPQTGAPRLAQVQEGLNAPFSAPGERAGATWVDQLGRPVVIAVGALLLGALVLVLLPDLRSGSSVATSKPEPAAAPMAEPVVLQPAAETALDPATPAGPQAPVDVAAVAPVAPAVEAPAALAPSPATDVQPVDVPASGVVVFRARAPSWIQVTDARGVVTLRDELEAGEAAGASGSLPLSVTVGSAGDTSVEVRGKAFDLAPFTRDNVARFEVK